MNDNLPTAQDTEHPPAIEALAARVRALRGRPVEEIQAALKAIADDLDEFVTETYAEQLRDAFHLGKEVERRRAQRR